MKKLMITLATGIIMAINSVEAAPTNNELNWVGCGITKKAFMSQLSSAYEQKTGVKINLNGGGATKGIREVKSISADMGGTCRHKLAESPEENGVRLVPVAWDALVVVTHKDNPVDDISLQELRDIYEGKITNWSQLGGPDADIALFARQGTQSGVGYALRNLLFRDGNFAFENVKQQFPSSGPLEKAIENSPLAMGVTGVSSAKKRDVKVLSLEGRDPSFGNIQNGSYTLYRPLYIAMNPSNENAREVKKFINFALSREGRSIIRRAGTVPYFEALTLIRKTANQRIGQLL